MANVKLNRLEQAAVDHAGPSPRGFIHGAEWMRARIERDIKYWLEVTGVIPKGTSYYAELLGCVTDAGREFEPDEQD